MVDQRVAILKGLTKRAGGAGAAFALIGGISVAMAPAASAGCGSPEPRAQDQHYSCRGANWYHDYRYYKWTSSKTKCFYFHTTGWSGCATPLVPTDTRACITYSTPGTSLQATSTAVGSTK